MAVGTGADDDDVDGGAEVAFAGGEVAVNGGAEVALNGDGGPLSSTS